MGPLWQHLVWSHESARLMLQALKVWALLSACYPAKKSPHGGQS